MATAIKTFPFQGGRAVKLTKNNLQKVSDWVTKAGVDNVPVFAEVPDPTKDKLRVKIKGQGWRVVLVGDILVKYVGDEKTYFSIEKA